MGPLPGVHDYDVSNALHTYNYFSPLFFYWLAQWRRYLGAWLEDERERDMTSNFMDELIRYSSASGVGIDLAIMGSSY